MMLEGYTLTILKGMQVTLMMSLFSLLLALALGMLCAMMRLSTHRWMNGIAAIYSTVIRGVPDLVLMLLLFYGGQSLINIMLEAVTYEGYVEVSAGIAGVLTVGLIFGAYMGETFRGALMAIPLGQSEAAYAYGLSTWQVFSRIRLPQMVRFALPGVTNNWLVLVKTTALVSVIGLQDMMYHAKRAGDATAKPFTYIVMVAGLYLLITTLSILILRAIGKRYSAGAKVAEL
jgi:His/Glu/Gln/Arg/opine family amino acid ABC transporter permease subunit